MTPMLERLEPILGWRDLASRKGKGRFHEISKIVGPPYRVVLVLQNPLIWSVELTVGELCWKSIQETVLTEITWSHDRWVEIHYL